MRKMWNLLNKMIIFVICFWFALIRSKSTAIATLTANTVETTNTVSVSTDYASLYLMRTHLPTPVLQQGAPQSNTDTNDPDENVISTSTLLESPSQKFISTRNPDEQLAPSPVLTSTFQFATLTEIQHFQDILPEEISHAEDPRSSLDKQETWSRTKKEMMAQKKSAIGLSQSRMETPLLSSFLQVSPSTESHWLYSAPNSMFVVLDTNFSEGGIDDLHSMEQLHLSMIPLKVNSSSILYQAVDLSSSKPIISVSTAMSMSTSTRVFVRSSNRKHERKQAGFQDIISGLVKLLGGKNVRVANGNMPLLENMTESGGVDVSGSRINHRAPPKVTFAEPEMKLTVQSTTTTPQLTSTSDIVTVMTTTRQSDVDTSTSTSKTTLINTKPTMFDDNIAILLESSLSAITNDKQTYAMSDTTRKTEDLPTGPITEWLPVRGAAVGYRPKETATTKIINISTSMSTNHSTLSTTSTATSNPVTKETISKEITTIKNDPVLLLPTEISYAGNVPSKPSTVEVVSTKSLEETLLQPTILTESTKSVSEEPHEPLAGTVGAVYPIVKPDDVPSHGDTFGAGGAFGANSHTATGTGEVPLAPTRSPTGSPFVIPVDIQKIRLGGEEGILSGPHELDQSVFIDGKKTYFNLMPTESSTGGDSTLVNVGIGYTFPNVADSTPPVRPHQTQGSVTNVRLGPQQSKPINRPQIQPVNKTPIRIDTCIIGDESACNVQWNETCRVEGGVSSCNCRLGYGRDGLEQGCKPVVSLTVYIKVDRVNHEQISFGPEYQHAESEKYQILEYEAKNAVDSVFSLSALAENFVGSNINSFFSVGGRVIINATVNLLESPQTRSPTIKQEIRRGLISVIQQQQQNIGQSRLYVNGPLNPIPGVQDLNECSDPNLNDCSKNALCTNAFGSFKCVCREGFLDKYGDDQRRSGRICTVCSPQYCNNRGECLVSNGVKECKCYGQYIGSQCETDGEVLGVALGASLAALLIIVLTLVCLCMWSRRWKKDQQKMLGRCQGGTLSNSYSYFNKPSAQTADFHLPSDDRIRWPRSSDQYDNFYAQPEPVITGANPRGYTSTRPPSQPPPPPPSQTAVTSTSTAHRAVQHLRSLPTTLTSSRSNILDDTDEVDEVNEINTNTQRFYFPRPKSRVANVNHGNVYYDVTFPNSRDQYTCNYDKDYGNITDVFPMKTINRPYHS